MKKESKGKREGISVCVFALSALMILMLIAAGVSYLFEEGLVVRSESVINSPEWQENQTTAAVIELEAVEDREETPKDDTPKDDTPKDDTTDNNTVAEEIIVDESVAVAPSDAIQVLLSEEGLLNNEPQLEVSMEFIEEENNLEQDDREIEESNNVPINVQSESGISAPVAITVTPESMINQLALFPSSTGSAAIDAYNDYVLSQIITDGMTTYERVKAVYDYLIYHTRYDQYIYILDDGSIVPYDGDQTQATHDGFQYGYQTLYSGRGVCDTYSCAFSMLCRRIGLNSYVIGGQTSRAGGGYTGHSWSVININGTEYIFDAQLDDQFANGGTIGYQRFFKTYDQVSGAYIPTGIIYDYMEPLSIGTVFAMGPITSVDISGSTITLQDGTVFDPAFYAQSYPDVLNAVGNDTSALLNHYLLCGRGEGRKPNANQ